MFIRNTLNKFSRNRLNSRAINFRNPQGLSCRYSHYFPQKNDYSFQKAVENAQWWKQHRAELEKAVNPKQEARDIVELNYVRAGSYQRVMNYFGIEPDHQLAFLAFMYAKKTHSRFNRLDLNAHEVIMWEINTYIANSYGIQRINDDVNDLYYRVGLNYSNSHSYNIFMEFIVYKIINTKLAELWGTSSFQQIKSMQQWYNSYEPSDPIYKIFNDDVTYGQIQIYAQILLQNGIQSSVEIHPEKNRPYIKISEPYKTLDPKLDEALEYKMILGEVRILGEMLLQRLEKENRRKRIITTALNVFQYSSVFVLLSLLYSLHSERKKQMTNEFLQEKFQPISEGLPSGISFFKPAIVNAKISSQAEPSVNHYKKN